jgi:signal transduction histidine kinase/HAMP domain-containing protein
VGSSSEVADPRVSRDTVPVTLSGLRSPSAVWRQLTLWPRLAIGVTIGFLVLFAGFSALGIRAVDASIDRILHERLVIAEELAQDFDGLLSSRFSELTAFDARPAPPNVEHRLLTVIEQASGGAFTTLSLVDTKGLVVSSVGPGAQRPGAPFARTRDVAPVLAKGVRAISTPFRDSRGRPVVSLVVPLRVHGTVRGALVGTLDLGRPDVIERLDAARRLGRTGHAELVGPGGIALASTVSGSALEPGEHLAFYREMLNAQRPDIATVPVTANHMEPTGLDSERHTMAFVRLTAAPWAVALGGTESDTFASARHLRRTLMLAGGGSLAVLWLLTLLGARLLVRPVRDLTVAAERMASGDLDHRVGVSEGGEIGVLAESLETMRTQLKDSLETVRRWGEQLETKVADRTSELNARNRQLAAVGAILTAANETHDLEEMLHRCLDVVLEQTAMDAAALELVDDGSGRPAVILERATWHDFPCPDCADRLVNAAMTDLRPLYLDSRERERLHPGCTVTADALAALPLRGPSGVLGVLTLGRLHGQPPTPEERPILTAICDQIAVAVENTRLAAELRRLEARHEVQRMRSELISAVSHELRTPLGFIKGYATTLLRDDTPIETPTQRHFLEIIDEETDKLEHMIDELLDASRLQAGRLAIEPEPVSLRKLVSRSVEKVRPALEGDGHAVTLRLPDEDVDVLVDPLRIEQVIDNLLENAGRYSDPSSPVDIDVVAENGHALVSVSDRGDEISPTDLEQIFEPFYRGRNAARHGIRGAGLGLAICRGIIEAHGGRIWAESGHGERNTFLLTLPITSGQVAG